MTEAIRLPCGGREPPHAKPKGNIMCNGGGAFSPEEVEYLRSLPVVAEAMSRRITYTESFKHNCMRRYHAGESPVELFRGRGEARESFAIENPARLAEAVAQSPGVRAARAGGPEERKGQRPHRGTRP